MSDDEGDTPLFLRPPAPGSSSKPVVRRSRSVMSGIQGGVFVRRSRSSLTRSTRLSSSPSDTSPSHADLRPGKKFG